MREIFEEVGGLIERERPFALATVVRTKGSTPQKPGSKMLVREDGSFAGTLGGGCIEADAYTASKLAMAEGTPADVQGFTLNDDLAAQDGLVCGGTMYIMIDQPQKDPMFDQYTQEINAAYRGEGGVALAMVTQKGAMSGEVGDQGSDKRERVEGGFAGRRFAGRCGGGVGVQGRWTSGGRTLYRQKTGPRYMSRRSRARLRWFWFGGGHVSYAIYKLATFLGYRTRVVDDREQFGNAERFPEADKIVVGEYDSGIRDVGITANSFVVVATRGHKYDDMALLEAAKSPAKFIGLLGSRRKALLIFPTLLSSGVSLERVSEIRTPVGLNLGGRTPESIALSVMAEIEMVRYGGDGASMKMDEKLVLKAREKAEVLA